LANLPHQNPEEKAVTSFATRRLRQRQALDDQAKVLVTRGQHDEALARLGEALDIAGRGLAEADPRTAPPQQMRAVILRESSSYWSPCRS
jgi:hypothetical protein